MSVSESLIWFTDWGVWNEIHERAGMYIIEQMRRANGEGEPLIGKPGHLFEASEAAALQSFLILPVFFSWDAYLAPISGEYFVFNSHDEFVCLLSKTRKTHERMKEVLRDWNPKEEDHYFR